MVLSGDSTANYEEFESAFSAGCAAISSAAASESKDGSNPSPASNPDHSADVARSLKAVSFLRRLQSLQMPMSHRLSGSRTGSSGLSSLLTTAQSRGTKNYIDEILNVL